MQRQIPFDIQLVICARHDPRRDEAHLRVLSGIQKHHALHVFVACRHGCVQGIGLYCDRDFAVFGLRRIVLQRAIKVPEPTVLLRKPGMV